VTEKDGWPFSLLSYVQGNAICGDVVLFENWTHGASRGNTLTGYLITVKSSEGENDYHSFNYEKKSVAEPLPGNGSVHCEVRPPSMIQLQPVIDVADGPNKKATKSATSSTVMNLFTR
jgi:hypothetical protein